MDNLELYSKVIYMINSCVTEAQMETTFNYIEQIKKEDESLANALMYPYHLKMELFN